MIYAANNKEKWTINKGENVKNHMAISLPHDSETIFDGNKPRIRKVSELHIVSSLVPCSD